MKRFCLLIALIFVLLTSISANAIVMQTLYQADVSVANNTQQEFQRAVPLALQQVFVKVSGNPQVINVPAVSSSLKNAANLVQAYNYTTTTQANTQNTQSLHVQFDANAVDQILRNAGQIVWNKDRPLTLVWLVVQNNDKKFLVPNDPNNSMITMLQQDANAVGLPLLWPEMDLQDVNALSVTDAWNLNAQALSTASNRYQADNILAGRISQDTASNWQGDWIFITSGSQKTWTSQGNNVNQVLADAVTQMVNAMTAGTTVTSGDTQKSIVQLKIVGINGLDDYADVVKYLRSLAVVVNVDASQIDNDNLLLNVTTQGGATALLKAISLNDKLVSAGNVDDETNNPSPIYTFRWNSAQTVPQPELAQPDDNSASSVNAATTASPEQTDNVPPVDQSENNNATTSDAVNP